jgi:3-oxoacyl-[acyl-carrier protein] reductase
MTQSRGTVLVSGGSRGLGLEIVEHLLGRGEKVATFARKPTPEVAALERKHPDRFHFGTLDMAKAEGIEPYVTKLVAERGPIWGLVNNAAVGQDHMLANMPPGKVNEILQINLVSTILLTRAVVRNMVREGTAGRVVNVSSICGMRGFPGLTVYSATKAGLDGFGRSLARELGSRGILVNSVAPGFFESEMSNILSPEQMDTIRRRSPTGHLTETQEIVPVVDLLLFGDSNITGQVVPVDGGSSL